MDVAAMLSEGVGASHHTPLLRDIPDENHAECETSPRPRPSHCHHFKVRELLRRHASRPTHMVSRGAGAVRPYSAAASAVCTRPGDRVACVHPWLSAAGMQRLHHAGSRGGKLTSSSGAPAHARARAHTHPRAVRPRRAVAHWRSNVITQFRSNTEKSAVLKAL